MTRARTDLKVLEVIERLAQLRRKRPGTWVEAALQLHFPGYTRLLDSTKDASQIASPEAHTTAL